MKKKAKKVVKKPAAKNAVKSKARVAKAQPAKPVAKAVPAKVVIKGKGKAAAPVVIPEAPPTKAKWGKEQTAKFHKLLLDLRDHLIDGVNFLASENLKRSHRDASGELSGYSLHMADAGTDNFDREFALSLVSSEQEGLYEIEEALKRLEGGTYGVCGMCDKLVARERLEAVPFARLCITCQAAMEKDGRGKGFQTVSSFTESADDEGDGDEGEDDKEKEK